MVTSHLHVHPFPERACRARHAGGTAHPLALPEILESLLPRLGAGIRGHPLEANAVENFDAFAHDVALLAAVGHPPPPPPTSILPRDAAAAATAGDAGILLVLRDKQRISVVVLIIIAATPPPPPIIVVVVVVNFLVPPPIGCDVGLKLLPPIFLFNLMLATQLPSCPSWAYF